MFMRSPVFTCRLQSMDSPLSNKKLFDATLYDVSVVNVLGMDLYSFTGFGGGGGTKESGFHSSWFFVVSHRFLQLFTILDCIIFVRGNFTYLSLTFWIGLLRAGLVLNIMSSSTGSSPTPDTAWVTLSLYGFTLAMFATSLIVWDPSVEMPDFQQFLLLLRWVCLLSFLSHYLCFLLLLQKFLM